MQPRFTRRCRWRRRSACGCSRCTPARRRAAWSPGRRTSCGITGMPIMSMSGNCSQMRANRSTSATVTAGSVPLSESTQKTALWPAAILGVPSPSTKAARPSRSNTSKVLGTRASASSTQLRGNTTASASSGRVAKPACLRRERMRGFKILIPQVSRRDRLASCICRISLSANTCNAASFMRWILSLIGVLAVKFNLYPPWALWARALRRRCAAG